MTHIAGKESTFDKNVVMEEHIHSRQEVYPESADSIQITAGTPAWTHGTKTEIVPAAGIGGDFDIHWVLVGLLSANGEYEIKLYAGPVSSEVEIGAIACSRNAIQSQEGSLPVITEIQKAGTRISASLATGTGVANTCNVKLFYHEY